MKKRRTGLFLFSALMLGACTLVHPPSMPMPVGGVAPGQSVTVGPGENLYTLAQRHGVRVNELVAVNQMVPPYRVKAGQTIVLPARASGGLSPLAAPRMGIETQTVEGVGSGVTSAPLDPIVIEKPVAAPLPLSQEVSTTAPDPLSGIESVPPRAPEVPFVAGEKTKTDEATFGWPVRGTILSAFGPKGKGQDNDGINIAAPKGAPVIAAQGGTVVYADNKMKGFGNLVLIRHQEGWVTAYAHLGRTLVKRDDVVAKGDMIGSVGSSGGVGSPQLHFETRRDGKPVDPELVLR